MIDDFIRKFMDKNLEWIKAGDDYYLLSKELAEIKDKIKLKPEYMGLFLGKDTNKGFMPSPALTEEIAKFSDKKIFVNGKAEMLFLCGRDLFGKSIIKANVKRGLVLVQNEKDENLGYGEIIMDINSKDRIVAKNLLDKGIYLRKEISKNK